MTTLPQPNTGGTELGREILEAALALAEAGYRVFPVHGIRRVPEAAVDAPVRLRCTCGQVACANPGKHPVGTLVPNGHNGATGQAAQVAQWFRVGGANGAGAAGGGGAGSAWTPWNLGVATGRGLVVVDADVKQSRADLPTGLEVLDDWETWAGGFSLQTTRTVRTGSGGLHLWYAVDPELRVSARNRVLPGLDVKGDGGYVLAAPSAHISGGGYEVIRDVSPVKASTELLTWLLTAKGGRYISRKAGDGTAVAPDDYNFHQILAGPGCPAGHRDYFVNDLCFRMRRAGTDVEMAARGLHTEWRKMEQGDDPFPWDACLYKLRRVWAEVEPGDVGDVPAWRPPTDTSPDSPAPGGNETISVLEILERPDLARITSDTGNGIRFAQRMRDVVRYCAGESRWYLWDGGRWKLDSLNRSLLLTEEVVKDLYVEAASLAEPARRDAVETWARTSQSAGRRDAMLRMAAAQPGIAIDPDDLDRDPWTLVVANGTLDLRSGTLRASEPADLCTRQAATVFDPGAGCPLWERHVDFITGGNAALAAYLRKAVGYTLTGLTDEQKLFFLWGNGANGKSTFVDVLSGMLGSYATQADENLLAGQGGHPTQLAGLRGARLVVADETGQGRKLAEQRVKAITGGKTIRARFMRQDFFEFTPRFKLWITGNHKPEIQGTDHGIWRRLKLIPFTAALSDDRRVLGYDDVLSGEAPGILNWALDGLRAWRDGAGLGDTDAVKEATREYRDEEDATGQWLAEAAQLGVADRFTENGALYESYRWWCHANGVAEVRSNIALGRELTARGLRRDSVKREGKMRRGFWGIRLIGGVGVVGESE